MFLRAPGEGAEVSLGEPGGSAAEVAETRGSRTPPLGRETCRAGETHVQRCAGGGGPAPSWEEAERYAGSRVNGIQTNAHAGGWSRGILAQPGSKRWSPRVRPARERLRRRRQPRERRFSIPSLSLAGTALCAGQTLPLPTLGFGSPTAPIAVPSPFRPLAALWLSCCLSQLIWSSPSSIGQGAPQDRVVPPPSPGSFLKQALQMPLAGAVLLPCTLRGSPMSLSRGRTLAVPLPLGAISSPHLALRTAAPPAAAESGEEAAAGQEATPAATSSLASDNECVPMSPVPTDLLPAPAAHASPRGDQLSVCRGLSPASRVAVANST